MFTWYIENARMNKFFLPILFSTIFFSVDAQNTWVQKLSYNVQSQGFFDTLTGVNQIEIGVDGSYYLHVTTNAHNAQKIYKFFPNSNQLEWSIDAGYDYAAGPQWTEHYKPTSDSGIIACYNIQHLLDPIYGWVQKYSKDGTLEWSTVFYIWDWNSLSDRKVSDVIEKSPGIYNVLVRDSMYTLDSNGNLIDSTGFVNGTRLIQMTNGDLLVLKNGNMLCRQDTLGNIFWSQPCNGPFAYDTASVYIVNSNSFVQKVNAITGNQIWNRDYGYTPVSDIKPFYPGGFAASIGYKPKGIYNWQGVPATPGYLFAADSTGDTLWTRTYPLPHYGLSAFNIVPGGNILTGGCYLSWNTFTPYKDFSAFCCMMNADGSYPLAQTDYVSPSDANHDHFSYFVDDALETMLAIGQTGTARDTSLDGIEGNGAFSCNSNNIAIDWMGSSAAGVNYKYADFDGNGLIDTNDVTDFDNCPFNIPDSIPLYYRIGSNDGSQSVNEFCLIPVHDTIQPGEPAMYYMVMGSGGNPIDSIYGFAFSTYISEWGSDVLDSAAYYNTSLGTFGINLFGYHGRSFVTNAGLIRNHVLMCRTDLQNATSVQDTVGLIRFSGFFQQSPIVPAITDFKAVLVSGTEIPFNVCAGSIYIDSSSVGVHEKQNLALSIFPNPSSNYLSVKNVLPGNKKITVLNSLGMIVKEFESAESQLQLSVEDLPNGIFNLSIQSDKSVNNTLFVVQH
ncbi:hypothetical protein BH11BAC1_BH11BAC1_02500 [soil metagenome]